MTTDLHLFGIRHHGPGSARSTLAALKDLQPDIVLVEGPPDAADVLPLLIDEEMQPPAALLIYADDTPSKAVYYPFMTFSPEYQAIRFALLRQIPVRFMDLPQRYQMMMRPDTAKPEESEGSDSETPALDPLSELARAAGYDDAERWWDAMVEQRQNSEDLFSAIAEAMTALREIMPSHDPMEPLREAWMRQAIHQAREEGFQRIAVVCGAWHVPALNTIPFSEEDVQHLSMLDSMPVSATWVPWTSSRLSRFSGYGAGVQSPGWYRFLWETHDPKRISVGWLTKVAQTLRQHGLDASPAQVIDAVQLVETVATLRGRVFPDLHDMNEAALSVMCYGNDVPMQIIARDVIVGHEMGQVPGSAPMVPLQRDFQRELDRLMLSLSEEEKEQFLDLREARDRDISRLLYRLLLLGLSWGLREDADILYEAWALKWDPIYVIRLIEGNVWGNTILDAATGYALHLAQEAKTLPDLTELVENVLLADLPQAIPTVVTHLENEAATTGDISQLMVALSPLTNSLMYGDVRRTETQSIRRVVDGMIVRIMIGLPTECVSLDDDAATSMLNAVIACDGALRSLNKGDVLADWHLLLTRLFDQSSIHGLLRGRFCRIVLDADAIAHEEAVRQMRLALAHMIAPEEAAAWLRGFLQDSGILLVHDETLLTVMDGWLCSLTVDEFERILPLLRRTTSTFEEPEIRHIGRRIARQPLQKSTPPAPPINPERANSIDALLTDLLGLKGQDTDEPHP